MAGTGITQQNSLSVRSGIYQNLYEATGFCSKQTLARACSVSMPTLYQNLNELMKDGLVRYSGEERSTGGRRAQGLEIVPDARISAGVSMTEHHLRLVAADLRLGELAYKEVGYDTGLRLGNESAEIARILEDFLDEFSIDRERLLGVGITIPGIISPDGLRVLFAPTLGIRNVPIHELVRDIPYLTRVENDGSASGHAECFARSGSQDMAYISLENGVGGAVLIGGKPYTGRHDRSGEFGHICVEPGGLRCNCGQFGCMEAYCSPRRIEMRFGVTLEEYFQGVEAHNPEYEALLHDMLRHLAVAVNNVHMTLDCDVILGGFLSEYLAPYLPILRSYVTTGNPFEEDAGFVQLSTLRHHITPLGAALTFIREFIGSV